MIGSLFSGVGGLELGLERATGLSTAWQCEYDRDASTVLAERFSVPNLHDITAVDWADVEPVEIVCGGFPCQPFSSAGRRKGTADGRWMWPEFARCVRALRPRYVVMENVAALLADAGAFGAVLGDLAEAGYDARWTCLRAADVGAPHRRERLFLVAEDAQRNRDGGEVLGGQAGGTDAVRSAGGPGGPSGEPAHTDGSSWRSLGQPVQGDGTAADGGRGTPEPGGRRRSATDATSDEGRQRDGDSCLAADAERSEPQRWRGLGQLAGTSSRAEGAAQQRQRVRSAAGDSGAAAADAPGERRPSESRVPDQGRALVGSLTGASGRTGAGPTSEGVRGLERGAGVAWGAYEPAIRWWSTIHGPAPAPVDDRGRLSPAFVEWMMGFPPGWVTDTAISRSAQLRTLGNAVVPQCAEAAWHLLTSNDLAVAS